jgi:hypothetical protein
MEVKTKCLKISMSVVLGLVQGFVFGCDNDRKSKAQELTIPFTNTFEGSLQRCDPLFCSLVTLLQKGGNSIKNDAPIFY